MGHSQQQADCCHVHSAVWGGNWGLAAAAGAAATAACCLLNTTLKSCKAKVVT
jgi:hypothetical protein